jgi:UDP-N-acetylglucosamine acyltransferase
VPEIHPTAQIHPSAVLADGVRVGPYAVIGAQVELGAGTEVGASAQVHGPSRLGRDNKIFPFAAVGFDPQDLTYKGEPTRLEVGDRNQFREYCTIHRGTVKDRQLTTIGSDNLFMVYTHVAHDCIVGDHTVFANCATLAGHVAVEDHATIGAFSAIHQFCKVGAHAYIGGYSVVTKDALPYAKTVGQKPLCYGLNIIGLQRKGFTAETIETLRQAFRLLVGGGLNTSQAVERIAAELGGDPFVDHLVDFVRTSKRGVVKARPGRGKGSRGGGGAGE